MMNYPHLQLLLWKVYRYYLANPMLLNEEKNNMLYEKAKNLLIDNYSREQNDPDKEAVERALLMVADWQIKNRPDNFEMDKETEEFLLNLE